MERYFKATPTQWGPGKIHLARYDFTRHKWVANCQRLTAQDGSAAGWPGVVLPEEGGDYPVNCKLCISHIAQRKQKQRAYA